MLRKRRDLGSDGGVGIVGKFFSDEYAGGDSAGGGIEGAARGSCGDCVEAS